MAWSSSSPPPLLLSLLLLLSFTSPSSAFPVLVRSGDCSRASEGAGHLCVPHQNRGYTQVELQKLLGEEVLFNSSREIVFTNQRSLNISVGCTSSHNQTQVESRPENCMNSLHSFGSHMSSLQGNVTALAITNTLVDTLTLGKALKSLQISWCRIGNITKMTVSPNARRVHIDRSTIIEISDMIVLSDLTFSHSTVKAVMQNGLIAHQTLNLINVSFKHVASNGIQILMGTSLVMKNCYVETLERHAVILTGGADLILENVKIDKCETPCFVVTSVNNVVISKNVIINGEYVHQDGFENYVVYWYNDIVPIKTISKIQTECSTESEKFICQFGTTNEVVKIGLFSGNYTEVQIRDSRDLDMVSNCSDLFIKNVTGSLRPDTHSSCDNMTKITIERSTLANLQGGTRSSLSVFSSFVGKLNDAYSSNVHALNNSRVGVMKNVIVPADAQAWQNTTFDIIKNISVYSNQLIENSFVTMQMSDVVVHNRLHLSSCFINNLVNTTVKQNASLVLENTIIRYAPPLSIQLEKGARLVVLNSSVLFAIAEDIISAHSYDQIVNYSYLSAGLWLPDIVVLRPELSLQFQRAHGNTNAINALLADKRFCSTSSNSTVCDYSRFSKGDVTHMESVSMTRFAVTGQVVYKNAYILQLRDRGYPAEVFVQDVKTTHVPMMMGQVRRLSVSNSSVPILDTQVQSLVLRDVTAGLVKSKNFDTLLIKRSTLEELYVTVRHAVVSGVQIKELTKLKATERVIFYNCNIENITRLSVFVPSNSTLVFANTVIGSIASEGIVVHGKIVLQDVVINSLDFHSIILATGNEDNIVIKNVTVRNKTDGSFVDLSKPDLEFDDMTKNITYMNVDVDLPTITQTILDTIYDFYDSTKNMLAFSNNENTTIESKIINTSNANTTDNISVTLTLDEYVNNDKARPQNNVLPAKEETITSTSTFSLLLGKSIVLSQNNLRYWNSLLFNNSNQTTIQLFFETMDDLLLESEIISKMIVQENELIRQLNASRREIDYLKILTSDYVVGTTSSSPDPRVDEPQQTITLASKLGLPGIISVSCFFAIALIALVSNCVCRNIRERRIQRMAAEELADIGSYCGGTYRRVTDSTTHEEDSSSTYDQFELSSISNDFANNAFSESSKEPSNEGTTASLSSIHRSSVRSATAFNYEKSDHLNNGPDVPENMQYDGLVYLTQGPSVCIEPSVPGQPGTLIWSNYVKVAKNVSDDYKFLQQYNRQAEIVNPSTDCPQQSLEPQIRSDQRNDLASLTSTQTPSPQARTPQAPSTQLPSPQASSTQSPQKQSTQSPSTQAPSTQVTSTQTSSTQTRLKLNVSARKSITSLEEAEEAHEEHQVSDESNSVPTSKHQATTPPQPLPRTLPNALTKTATSGNSAWEQAYKPNIITYL